MKFIARLSTINWTIYYLPVDFQVCHFLIYDVLTAAAAVAAPGGNIDFGFSLESVECREVRTMMLREK